jgi:hypothetical protein
MTVIEYRGFRIEVSHVGRGWRAAILAPGSIRALADSPSNLEKSSTEEIVAEAKRIIDARFGPRSLLIIPTDVDCQQIAKRSSAGQCRSASTAHARVTTIRRWSSRSVRCRRVMNVSRWPGHVRLALRESEPDLSVMTPPHNSVHDPVFFRDAQFDLVRNVDRIKNDDPGTRVRNILNEAGHRRAAIVKVDSTA